MLTYLETITYFPFHLAEWILLLIAGRILLICIVNSLLLAFRAWKCQNMHMKRFFATASVSYIFASFIILLARAYLMSEAAVALCVVVGVLLISLGFTLGLMVISEPPDIETLSQFDNCVFWVEFIIFAIPVGIFFIALLFSSPDPQRK